MYIALWIVFFSGKQEEAKSTTDFLANQNLKRLFRKFSSPLILHIFLGGNLSLCNLLLCLITTL